MRRAPAATPAVAAVVLAAAVLSGCSDPATSLPAHPSSAAPLSSTAPMSSTAPSSPTAAGPAASGPAAAPALIGGPVEPGRFVAAVTNPWFPLRPGDQRAYQGTRDGKKAHEVFAVTSERKTILGVSCVVVRDTLNLDGHLAEQTDDWYAQDNAGNVWYFGEETATYNPDGSLKSREGRFTAGVDGARAGIYITAQPQPGVDYQQESYPGHAEDHFVVTDLSVPVTVKAGSFPHALRTKEYTPLEPGVTDHKFYARDIGVVKEESADGSERLELLAATHR